MRYAMIDNNTVTNIIEADGPEALPGLTLLEALPTTDIGDVLIDGQLPQPEPMPEPDPAVMLAAAKEQALVQIDTAAETERAKYITPGSGQAMVYQRKLVEAGAVLSGADGPFPHLEAEIGITAPTLDGVAESVLTMEAQWAQVSAVIEAARLSAKAGIRACTTVEAVDQVLDSLRWSNP